MVLGTRLGTSLAILSAIAFATGLQQLRRKNRSNQVAAPTTTEPNFDWRPAFEIVKELNNQAGRLATLLALIVAAASISLTNGPIHDSLAVLDLDYSLVYACLVFFALVALRGLACALYGLDPTLPRELLSPAHWYSLIESKENYCRLAKRWMVVATIALSTAWPAAYGKPPLGAWAIPFVLFILQAAALPGLWRGRPWRKR